MLRGLLTAVICVAATAAAVGCSKGAASGADAADAPASSDAPASNDVAVATDATDAMDATSSNDAPTDVTAPTDATAGQCPQDLPVDAAPCSTPNVTCPYTVACGQRDFLCFAFEVGAPAKWICLHNCACDGGVD